MFTGIIDHQGVVTKKTSFANGVRLSISTSFQDLVLGESISVNGVCLTVEEFNSEGFHASLSPETLACTTASQWSVGTRLNLERALRMGDRLGGHWVMGHIDGIASVVLIEKVSDEYHKLGFKLGAGLPSTHLIPKGSVAINGVSLTLNTVSKNDFEVMIIPHTWQITQLSTLAVGDQVNIELDWMVKVLLHQKETMYQENK